MGSESQYKAYIDFPTTVDQDEDSPVDTAQMRSVLINNAIHLYEQSSQVRICWADSTSTISDALDPVSAGEWKQLVSIPFVTKLKPDGSSFTWRVRLAGRVSVAQSIDFRFAITAPDRARTDIEAGPSERTNVATATSISSTSAAWLTLNTNTLTLPANEITRFVHTQYPGHSTTGLSTADEAPGVVELRADVWGNAGSSTKARVCGMVVQEFYT